MMPRVPSGFAKPKPSAIASTPNRTIMEAAPSIAGVSQPATATRTGVRSAVTARRETGLTIRNSA